MLVRVPFAATQNLQPRGIDDQVDRAVVGSGQGRHRNDLVPAEPLLHCQDRRSRPTSSNAGDLTGAFCTRWKERESEAALAHVVWDKVEAAYARSDLFARRHQLMDEWAAYVNGGTRASHVAPSVISGDLPTHAQRRGGDRQGGGSAPSHTERGRPASWRCGGPQSHTMESLSEKDDQRGDNHLSPCRRHGHCLG